jgi:hypothetical protein
LNAHGPAIAKTTTGVVTGLVLGGALGIYFRNTFGAAGAETLFDAIWTTTAGERIRAMSGEITKIVVDAGVNAFFGNFFGTIMDLVVESFQKAEDFGKQYNSKFKKEM